jgi:multiple sugar transport system substrate-binding protein
VDITLRRRFLVALAVGGLFAASAAPVWAQSPAASPSPQPTTFVTGPASVPPGVTLVRWYCCLGAGNSPEQVAVEQQVVENFNATHTDIQVSFEGVQYLQARDALATQIASGNPPDIVGPVGIGGANAFGDQWLDLAPLIESTGYDMSQFPEGAVDTFKLGDTQTGIPFAIYPSLMFYQRDMFDEIGLNPPPSRYGDKYTMPDGTEVDWDYDTLRQLGLMLTVDTSGKDATQEGFDPSQIAQWGFEPQRDDLRGMAASWKAGTLVGDDGKATIPDAWATAWRWLYDGIWADHFIMPGQVYQQTEMGGASGNAFCSGRVAMDLNFLWSTYCLADAGDNWATAIVPSFEGQTTAAFNADTFRIMKGTKNPEAAFTVLTYLLGEASADLLHVYGGMPARPAEQQAFFDGLTAGFPDLQQPPDWQVAIDGVAFADSPNFESEMPNYNQSLDVLTTYQSRWTQTDGLNMDDEIPQLAAELQAVWDQ